MTTKTEKYDAIRKDAEQAVKAESSTCDAYPRHLVSGLEESMLCKRFEPNLVEFRITPTTRMYRM